MEGPTSEQVNAFEGGCDLVESSCWSRLLAGPVAQWNKRSPHWSGLAGRTFDPVGDPHWTSLFLKDYTPWKAPILEQFLKNCSLWEGLMLEQFVEDCGGTPSWSRGREEAGRSSRNKV